MAREQQPERVEVAIVVFVGVLAGGTAVVVLSQAAVEQAVE
jgi:hypothetical protein